MVLRGKRKENIWYGLVFFLWLRFESEMVLVVYIDVYLYLLFFVVFLSGDVCGMIMLSHACNEELGDMLQGCSSNVEIINNDN